MIHFTVISAVFIACALFSASSLSMASSPSAPPVLQNQDVEAAIEGETKKFGILEATRSKTKSSGESPESVDCFYETNKFHTDCREKKSRER